MLLLMGYFMLEKYNYVPVARQTLYSSGSVVSVIIMLGCQCVTVCVHVCVYMAKREWEWCEIVDVVIFKKNVERSMRCCCRWRGLKRAAFVVLAMKGHKPFFMKDKSTHFDWLIQWKGSSWEYLWNHQQWWTCNSLFFCFWRIIFHSTFWYK